MASNITEFIISKFDNKSKNQYNIFKKDGFIYKEFYYIAQSSQHYVYMTSKGNAAQLIINDNPYFEFTNCGFNINSTIKKLILNIEYIKSYESLVKTLTYLNQLNNFILTSRLMVFILKYCIIKIEYDLYKILIIVERVYYKESITNDYLAISYSTINSYIMNNDVAKIELFNIFIDLLNIKSKL